MTDNPEVVTSISPTPACRRLDHRIEWREVAAGTGDRVEVCALCSKAYAMALAEFGDVGRADEFVRELRRDERPWNAGDA